MLGLFVNHLIANITLHPEYFVAIIEQQEVSAFLTYPLHYVLV